MEVVIKYKARNGMEFDDPYDCEKYEKILAKMPGTLGYFLANLEEFKDTDYFAGIVFYKEKDAPSVYSRCNLDFSDLFEGEIITQPMKEAQNRVRSTVGDLRKFFKDKDHTIPCGGAYVCSPDPLMTTGKAGHVDCTEVFRQKKV